ncbi:PhlD [Streptomyces sp. SAJ15]|uniref:PhlD n=1 Tax=Streptomyces sp. SAJ15 TaxID=2011095 RepID=UPI0021B18753|nr:PhlD [Streptomyces sp. SAJ15]
MPPAYISRPSLAHPQHEITTDEICADIARAHHDHPRLAALLRIARATKVATRRFTRPLGDRTISGDAPITERNAAAYHDAARLAATAAARALAQTGLEPTDIDCVITSHTTSWTVPGLDVHLLDELGIRRDVRRVPMSTLGCVGGAQALVKAVDHVAAYPGSRVLVVVAEALSSVYNHADTTTESMIYKALFGDSAGAFVVTDTPLGPGLEVDSVWEYVLPVSRDRYRGRLDATGLHFLSTKAATESTTDVMPALHEFLDRAGIDTPEFVAVHPGGPRIIADAERGLGIDQEPGVDDEAKMTRHSWASLRQRGNLGGVAILDVLARTYDDPPAEGARGVLFAFGPGFATAACTATWRDQGRLPA